MNSLFNFGDFPLHSGGRSNFKIDCDHLTDDDLESLAALAASRYQWSYALGIGTGGSRFACVLAQYNTKDDNDPRVIVDDVLTTGGSMEAERAKIHGESFGLVIFARSQPAEWIRPLFRVASQVVGSACSIPSQPHQIDPDH